MPRMEALDNKEDAEEVVFASARSALVREGEGVKDVEPVLVDEGKDDGELVGVLDADAPTDMDGVGDSTGVREGWRVSVGLRDREGGTDTDKEMLDVCEMVGVLLGDLDASCLALHSITLCSWGCPCGAPGRGVVAPGSTGSQRPAPMHAHTATAQATRRTLPAPVMTFLTPRLWGLRGLASARLL